MWFFNVYMWIMLGIEEIIFRVMFHTAFVRSGILNLSCDEVDVMWDARDQMQKNFKAKVCFLDADALPSIITTKGEYDHKNGTESPTHEECFKVEEIFSNAVDEQKIKVDAENGDIVLKEGPAPESEVDAFEDYEPDDGNKKPENKILIWYEDARWSQQRSPVSRTGRNAPGTTSSYS
ncbi:putative tensin phosphatase, C2 domain, C2 domain superfamily [Helianthus debilis subsp. tardiflorus]